MTTAIPAAPLVLRRASLRDQALGVLRAQLATGVIAEGEIHSAAALAERLGVSNSPIREAMLTLVNQGVMEPVRNRGFRVVPLSDQARTDIYDLRVLLEVPAMGALARRGHDDWSASEELAESSVVHAVAGRIEDYLEADRAFHLGLLGLLGNRRLVGIVADLRDRTRLANVRSLADAGLIASSAREHLDLVAALRAGDPERARRIMQAHLDHIPGDWNQA